MRSPMLLSSVVVLAATLAACASTPPSHHPSAAGHEAMARSNERAAEDHITAGIAPTPRSHCGDSQVAGGVWATCWTVNDDANRVEAEQHYKEARAHRAASKELREAEARACQGLSDIDREVSPFAHVKDILDVQPIRSGDELRGAKVTFRAVPGLTRDSLRHIVDCHIAQADALGHETPEESFCPLNLPDVRATVSETPRGFDVFVVTDDGDAAREVLRRAQALRE